MLFNFNQLGNSNSARGSADESLQRPEFKRGPLNFILKININYYSNK